MPGVYVANRNGHVGRAGLALPFTPTTGPIKFAQNWNEYVDVAMHHCYFGDAGQIKGGGLCTHFISECAVFAVAERKGGAWGKVYFAHIQGGDWSGFYAGNNYDLALKSKEKLREFSASVNLNDCYGLIVCPGPMGYSRFVEYPQSLGFPENRMSVYISNTSGSLGMAVEFKVMGEFGEIDSPQAFQREGPYGKQKGMTYGFL